MSEHEHPERGLQGDIGHTGIQGERGYSGVAPFVVRHAVIAYLILCMGVGLALYRTVELSHRQDRQLCAIANENRDLLRELINRTGNTITIPPDATPELRQVLEQSRESGRQFREYANSKLSPVQCPR